MDALADVFCEILTHELGSNLAFFLILSISKPCVVLKSNFRRVLLSSSQTTTQILDALAVEVREILTHEKAYIFNIYLYTHTHTHTHTHTITLNNSRTKVGKAWKFWLWVVQVLVMTSPKFCVFSIVCSSFF